MKFSVHLVLAFTAIAMLSADAFSAQYAWSVTSPVDSHLCALSEEALVTATLTRDGIPVADELVTLAVEGDVSARQVTLVHTDADGNITVPLSLARPGFLRAAFTFTDSDDRQIRAEYGVGFAPEEIRTGRTKPADFDAWWDDQLAQMAAMPMNAEVIEVEPNRKEFIGRVRVYSVKIKAMGDQPYVYGYVSMPIDAQEKSLPIFMSYHGAGFGSAGLPLDRAAEGYLAMDVSAHGLPNAHGVPNAPPENFYREYEFANSDYITRGWQSRDTLYFRSMILRAVRGLQYAKSLPQWDGKTIIVSGGSQGGGQSLAVAGLDPQVTFCFAAVPALADHGAATVGREGGWPRIISRVDHDPRAVVACDYIDSAFFASRINAECILTVGFIDSVCAPATVYAAYNAIPSPNKRIIHHLDLGHTMPDSDWKTLVEEAKAHVEFQNAN